MLSIPAEEMAEGDWSPEYGHIADIEHDEDDDTYKVTFVNGTELILAADAELELNQGGRFT